MSTLTQFMLSGSGSSGSSSALNGGLEIMPHASGPIVEDANGEFYVRSGVSVYDLPESTLQSIAAKSTDFLVPDSQAFNYVANAAFRTSYAYGNGVYIASHAYSIMRSTNGLTWTPVEIAQRETNSMPISNVVFFNNLFYVIIGETYLGSFGNGLTIASSADGITWTVANTRMHAQSVEPLNSNVRRSFSLTVGGGFIWATFQTGDTGYVNAYTCVVRSANGMVWTNWANVQVLNINTTTTPKVVVGGSNVVVVHTVDGSGPDSLSTTLYGTTSAFTSTAGYSASQGMTQCKYLNSTAFVGLVGVSSTTTSVYTSTTGSTWTARTIPVAFIPRDVTFAAGLYVIVGDSGNIITSPDLVTWTSRTSGTTDQLRAIIHDGTRFIALGNTGIRLSTDGITWTAATVPALGTRSTQAYDAAASAGDQILFAGGLYHAQLGSGSTFLTSSDGITWTARLSAGTSNTTSNRYDNQINTTSNALFSLNDRIFVPNGDVTTGGITTCLKSTGEFTTVAYGTRFFGMAHGAGTYVAVGASGAISTSTDGLTWTPRTSGTTNQLSGVVWNGTNFVTISTASGWRSPDGITWTSIGSVGGTMIVAGGNGHTVIFDSATQNLRVSVDGGVSFTNYSVANNGFTQLLGTSFGAVLYGQATGCYIVNNGSYHVYDSNSFYVMAEIRNQLWGWSTSNTTLFLNAPYNAATSVSNSVAASNRLQNQGAFSDNATISTTGRLLRVSDKLHAMVTTSNGCRAMYDRSFFTSVSGTIFNSCNAVAFTDTNVYTLPAGQLAVARRSGVSSFLPAMYSIMVGGLGSTEYSNLSFFRKVT